MAAAYKMPPYQKCRAGIHSPPPPVIASPCPVILTLNEVKGKNLTAQTLRLRLRVTGGVSLPDPDFRRLIYQAFLAQ